MIALEKIDLAADVDAAHFLKDEVVDVTFAYDPGVLASRAELNVSVCQPFTTTMARWRSSRARTGPVL